MLCHAESSLTWGGAMAGKARTVFFYSAVEIDKDGRAHQFGKDWWGNFLAHVASLDEPDRQTYYHRRHFTGEVAETISPAVRYLRVGKQRPGADWPDIEFDEGDEGARIAAIVEPLYIVPVTGTAYVAIVRTSGAATWEALTDWISTVGKFIEGDTAFALEPYTNRDQLDRLASAVGASKVYLKVDPEGLDRLPGKSELGQAVARAAGAGAGAVSVEITVSFGRSRAEEAGAESLIEGVREVISSGSYTHAKATLLQPSDDGAGVSKDPIDFVMDRVTFREAVGDSEDEVLTPDDVIGAMSDAITRFRERLPKG
ncbi:hypothetical protein GCM10009561_10370 [Frigoribacterium faeni]